MNSQLSVKGKKLLETQDKKDDNIKWLIALLEKKLKKGFFGQIEINIKDGNIINANIVESVKP